MSSLSMLENATESTAKITNRSVSNHAQSAWSSTPIDGPFAGLNRLMTGEHSSSHREESMEERGYHQVTINILSDDALLEVFHHCRGDSDHLSMRIWKHLVHVCKRWRLIIFASPQHLRLLLRCTGKTPTTESLDIWPPLPIYIYYFPDGTESNKNIIAALERRDRIKVFFARISSSALETLSAFMQEPLPALKELNLLGENAPVLPKRFLGGSAPRLRSCALVGIAFPALPTFLISTLHLVNLVLYNIPNSGYISPEVMANCLATLPNLKTFRLILPYSVSRPELTGPAPLARPVLPSLTHFHFRGIGEYLADLVARLDTPLLHHLDMGVKADLNFDISRFRWFIDRAERFKGFYRATAKLYPWSIRITDGLDNHLDVKIGLGTLSLRASSLARLCNCISPLLLRVESLAVHANSYPHVAPQAATESVPWLELLRPFTAVDHFSVSKEVVPDIARVLGGPSGERATDVLPALRSLTLEGFDPSGSVQEIIEPFLTARRVSDHPVTLLDGRE